MFFIKIYIKESYMNYYDTSIQMCGQYCILAPNENKICDSFDLNLKSQKIKLMHLLDEKTSVAKKMLERISQEV